MSRRDKDATDHIVATNIRLYREKAGMTQVGLADAIGVTFQQVGKYEACTDRVSAGRLKAIADAVGEPVASFFAPAEPAAA